MAARLQSMIMLIQSLHKAGSPTHAKAPRTANSFVLQEAEAAARNAKIAWCHAHGKRVISLQHDGILVADIVPGSEPQTAAALSAVAADAAGVTAGADAADGSDGVDGAVLDAPIVLAGSMFAGCPHCLVALFRVWPGVVLGLLIFE